VVQEYILTQMHIEAARNSTDDFNLFHDKNRWQRIKSNPFQGPIALGFQLACFIENQIRCSGKSYQYDDLSIAQALPYSIYELTFAGVVKPGDTLSIAVRDGKSAEIDGHQCFSNRIALKANGKTVLLGYRRESKAAMLGHSFPIPDMSVIRDCKDRTFVEDSSFFLKRKYIIVGNAKNFLTSAFAEQSEYIDEFIDKVDFPETYPLSLVSSALLERAQALGHDLIKSPMIYTYQKLSICKTELASLRSNHMLSILVGPAEYPDCAEEAQGGSTSGRVKHYCCCLLNNGNTLFQAEIQLVPLSSLIR
jgi:hypothetical protein